MRLLTLLVLCTLAAASCKPNASIAIACSNRSAKNVQCTATSSGPQPARPCWDVIVTCNGVEAEAEKVCARKLSPGESDTVVVEASAFKPAVEDFAACVGLHHDELSVE